jgi:hypothetical protein
MAISLKAQIPGTVKLQARIWTLWWLLLAGVGLLHLLTLTISPTVWMDEIFIVEFGRLTFEPNTDWSIMWADRPLLLLNYLGSALQEIAFQASNLSVVGPRFSALVGGLLAATTLFGYLLARQIPQKISFLLAATLLLEPMFVQSYRGGRVDGWAIAACLLSCWLLRVAMNRGQNGKTTSIWIAIAGGLAVVGQFMWISAVLLYPLILIEFLELLAVFRKQRQRNSDILQAITALVLGGLVVGLILMVPIFPRLGTIFSDFITLSKNNQTIRDRSNFFGEIPLIWAGLLNTYKLNPLLLPTVGLGMVFSRDRKLLLTTLFVFGLILVTFVYQFRCIYVLPYFACLMAAPFHPTQQGLNHNIRPILVGLLLVLLLWGGGLSLVVRPALALKQSAGRAPDILCEAGMELVGSGAKPVYLGTPELYYSGRSLGWKMYKVVGNRPDAQKLLPKINYVVGIPQQLDDMSNQIVHDFDLKKQSIYKSKFAQNGSSAAIGAKPYDSFIAFSR